MELKKKVPEVRFKGFSGEWEEKELGKLFDITSASRVHKNEWTESGIPFFRSSDVVADYKGQENIKAFISYELYKELSSKTGCVQKNDILVTGGGSIGIPYLVKNDEPLYFKDADLLWLKNGNIINGNFLYTFFSTLGFRRYVNSITHIGTISHYTVEQAKLTPFKVPVRAEQDKIGDYLLKLDQLITLHQKKYNKLTNIKKAMLEKMFPKNGADVPEIRFEGFEGKWEKRIFGECVLIQRGGSPRPIENYMTDDENGINWIKIGDVSNTSRYITKTKEKIIQAGEKHSRRVYEGDLILSNSMSFGRPYIMAIDGCIHDGWLLIRDENKVFHLEYLLQLLSSDYMFCQYRALASGGVVINLNSELVQSTIVYVPIKEEQQKIGTYFQKLDHLITLQQTQLEKLKNIKKACLEKMFV